MNANQPGWVKLLESILRDSIPLRDGLCRDPRQAQLFDGATEDDVAEAVAICSRCPDLQRCEAWYVGLKPSKRPVGICAAQINRPGEDRERRPRGRPRKTAVSS